MFKADGAIGGPFARDGVVGLVTFLLSYFSMVLRFYLLSVSVLKGWEGKSCGWVRKAKWLMRGVIGLKLQIGSRGC